jgi:hypothetical protein
MHSISVGKTVYERVRTMRSGKVLAVELTVLVTPQLLPAPVMKLNRTRVYNPKVDRDAAPSGIPSSYRWRIPEYPPRRSMNPHAKRMRGPR